MLDGMTVLDSHVHYAHPIPHETLTRVLELTGTDMVALAALPTPERASAVPDILAYKHAHPDTTYAFGCADISLHLFHADSAGRRMRDYAKRLLDMGCDGVKLLDGKPTMRRLLPIRDFDSPAWAPFFAYAEKTRLPLLFHVNDPAEFWDADRVSAHARAQGWCYGANDVAFEAQLRQIEAMLGRYPGLSVTFAHMLFLSGELDRLSGILDRFPNVRVDLTPGIELYAALSRDASAARDFLLRYQDRVLYGTDIGARAVLKNGCGTLDVAECRVRAGITQGFLTQLRPRRIEADGRFLIDTEPFTLAALRLPRPVQQRLLCDNFLSFMGAKPRPVNGRAVRKECGRLRRIIPKAAAALHVNPDLSAVNAIESYFAKENGR